MLSPKIECFSATIRAHTTSSVLTTLDAQLAQLTSQSAANKLAREEHERLIQSTLAEVKKEAKASARTRGGGGGPGAYDRDEQAMDVDEPRGPSGMQNVLADANRGRKFK